MNVKNCSLVVLKKSFYQKVNDKYLLYKDRRPHFMAYKDKATKLLWMVPCTSYNQKWQDRANQKHNLGIKIITILN
jgi:hypothetical protein